MNTSDYEKIKQAGAASMTDLHSIQDDFREYHPHQVGASADELNTDELAHWRSELERRSVPIEYWPEWAKGSGE